MDKKRSKGDQLDEEQLDEGSVEKYSPFTVFAHWVLMISVIGLIFTGGLPLFNSLINFINVIDISVPELPYSSLIHVLFGIFLVFGIVFVAFTHDIRLKEILGGRTRTDIGAFVRTFTYIVGLEGRLESGGGNKFYGYQKVTFVIVLFSLWMLIFSGLLLLFNVSQDTEISRAFIGNILILHKVGAALMVLFLVYHIIMIVRRLDKHSLKCMLYDGRLPTWYVKKNHKLWYNEINKLED